MKNHKLIEDFVLSSYNMGINPLPILRQKGYNCTFKRVHDNETLGDSLRSLGIDIHNPLMDDKDVVVLKDSDTVYVITQEWIENY